MACYANVFNILSHPFAVIRLQLQRNLLQQSSAMKTRSK